MQDKYVIIVAGGKGLRMGSDSPKQFQVLCGRPVLMHTLDAFYDYDHAIRILLVLPDDQKVYWKNLCTDYDFNIPHVVVSGGETRFHSVKNGLSLIEKQLADNEQNWMENALIGIHDGVRPLVSKALIARTYEQAALEKGAYPVIPVTDSLRKSTGVAAKKFVPVDRSKYFLVQTPQVFWADLLIAAYKQEYKEEFTDDVSVVEAAGTCHPTTVEGKRENLKITTPIDFAIAQTLIKCKT
ncbi:MAG: 2-C-methyl-D-erythritol 4-phosphate cytidylyltransferase [Candidatus Symbiothrix sp.]|jgi:2-C-methyl-D-erythritol 4-phosphate cytidylyltransferase|nr:2-C-methyl-D-erythritol 4-phosphate cytidylyltransferase [Candidatus Symbiothrix sp.]